MELDSLLNWTWKVDSNTRFLISNAYLIFDIREAMIRIQERTRAKSFPVLSRIRNRERMYNGKSACVCIRVCVGEERKRGKRKMGEKEIDQEGTRRIRGRYSSMSR